MEPTPPAPELEVAPSSPLVVEVASPLVPVPLPVVTPDEKELKQLEEFRQLVHRDKYLSFSEGGVLLSGSMEHLTRYVIFNSFQSRSDLVAPLTVH
jgi:hypothetical protein